jgi:hypothetical protein
MLDFKPSIASLPMNAGFALALHSRSAAGAICASVSFPRGEQQMSKHDFGKAWHEKQIGSVAEEIARSSYICGIRLLDPGVIERVLKGDESVCSKPNAVVFRKLQGLASMHFMLTQDSVQVLGQQETENILAVLRERFRDRFQLGGLDG